MQLLQCTALDETLVLIEEAKPKSKEIVTEDVSHVLCLGLGEDGHVFLYQIEVRQQAFQISSHLLNTCKALYLRAGHLSVGNARQDGELIGIVCPKLLYQQILAFVDKGRVLLGQHIEHPQGSHLAVSHEEAYIPSHAMGE